MLPNFLIPETVIREAGTGPELSLSSMAGGLLLLTLGITRIIEQQSLDISIWGSADNADWGAKPLLSFPQKFYCGTYQLFRLERQPGHQISAGQVASQPLGPRRPQTAVRHLSFCAGC